MQERKDIIHERGVVVGKVAVSAMAAYACHLQRVLIVEHMIDLLRIGRAACRYGDIDRMEISDVNVDKTAVRVA